MNKTPLTTRDGRTVDAITPVILSASRSTDIPACYAKWLIERIKDEGRDEGRNEGFAKAKEELIINLIESNAGTIEQIATWVKLPVKEVKKIAATVPVEA